MILQYMTPSLVEVYQLCRGTCWLS